MAAMDLHSDGAGPAASANAQKTTSGRWPVWKSALLLLAVSAGLWVAVIAVLGMLL